MPRKLKIDGENLVTRVKRIQGQVGGVEKLMNEKASCLEVCQQILAAKNALGSLAVEILSQESCNMVSKEKRKELLEKLIKEV